MVKASGRCTYHSVLRANLIIRMSGEIKERTMLRQMKINSCLEEGRVWAGSVRQSVMNTQDNSIQGEQFLKQSRGY
jgi:hypothetical protein